MPGFFEALGQWRDKTPERAKPIVTIDGKAIEVSLELYQQIILHGEHEYRLSDGKIVRKPHQGAQKECLVLGRYDEGHSLVDGHPYWPDKKTKGGYAWQIEQE
jgi:hypothetical protein